MRFSKAASGVPRCPEEPPQISLGSEEHVGRLSGFQEPVPRTEKDTAPSFRPEHPAEAEALIARQRPHKTRWAAAGGWRKAGPVRDQHSALI